MLSNRSDLPERGESASQGIRGAETTPLNHRLSCPHLPVEKEFAAHQLRSISQVSHTQETNAWRCWLLRWGSPHLPTECCLWKRTDYMLCMIGAYAISINRTGIKTKLQLAPKMKKNATSQTFLIFSCCSSCRLQPSCIPRGHYTQMQQAGSWNEQKPEPCPTKSSRNHHTALDESHGRIHVESSVQTQSKTHYLSC